MIREAAPADTPTLCDMADATGMFKPHEILTLREVLDDFHADEESADRCRVWDDGVLRGFVYYAAEPMTLGTWSLWWIVVATSGQGRGLGGRMLRHVEDDIRSLGGRVLFVETSGLPTYEPTRRFYLKHAYDEEATLRDYYAPGDDQVVYRKAL